MDFRMDGRAQKNNPFVSLIIGIVLFLGSFVLLWWNEGNYVKNVKIADFVQENVIDATTMSPENNGKLIHITNKAVAKGYLGDELLKVNALALSREVEMYQWEEKSKKDNNNNTTYTHSKVWSDRVLRTSSPSHSNPTDMPMKSTTFHAQNASFDKFILSDSVMKKLLPNVDYKNLPPTNYAQYRSIGNYYYSGISMSAPSIGDVRISYRYLASGSTLSIIAKQASGYLNAYRTKLGSIALVENGNISADDMIQNYRTNNEIQTNAFRLLGVVLMGIGLSLLSAPLIWVFSFVGLGSLVEGITGFISFLVAFILSSITIAIAWIAYRPLIGCSILAVAGVIGYFGFKKLKPKQIIQEI